ncbi:MAG: hypothetical protein BroJett030_25030 [Alphaproteobacteria bacterium]|nr:MAG: hypothetical protein BroJett030_25030 [Alphaproteobacteria bacterium]
MRSSRASRSSSDETAGLAAWFAALAGSWRLTRQASDGSYFAGKADFVADGARGWLESEAGTFVTADGRQFAAGRQWRWRLTAGGVLDIAYPPPDERPYHRFAPQAEGGEWRGEAIHVCGADRYLARYRLAADMIEIIHHVSGPAKDYRLTGRFTRPG